MQQQFRTDSPYSLLVVTVQATGVLVIPGAPGCSRLKREGGPKGDLLDDNRAVEKLVDWMRTISKLEGMKVPRCLQLELFGPARTGWYYLVLLTKALAKYRQGSEKRILGLT